MTLKSQIDSLEVKYYLMRTHLVFQTRAFFAFLAILCMTSCKENQELQQKLEATNTKIQSLQKELAEMDAKLLEHRQNIPAYAGTGEAGAKQYAVQLASELVGAENEAARLQTAIQAAEAALTESQKSFELVKSKDPR